MKSKFCFLFLFIILLTTKVYSQASNFSFGAELNFPSGNSTNISAIGMGALAKLEFPVANKYAITAQAGVTTFLGKKYFGNRLPTEVFLPLKGGLKYYTSENFYIEGQVGAVLPIDSKTSTSLVLSPGIGTFVPTRGTAKLLDIGLRYESWTKTKFNFISFRIAYSLPI